MRNKIFGALGIVWGGWILISTILRGGPQGGGAYAAGEYGGLVFGILLLVLGLYTFFKPSLRRSDSPKCTLRLLTLDTLIWLVGIKKRTLLANRVSYCSQS